ncbi:hypothetical protein I204_08118 [Kwoniella mangroviensis CBS 8886]|uniref:uncharacterized protein n=1 Tax=Kwoniella mangroviensis CBS 8507 TaxID=1296122 RepID=UPI00080D3D39|nr:uncharacterized protein I203_04522 [Kwoniella mangroviensis CBS 8507]OCF66196.1 hypothetical protein I203_04522 [Kwoniella mangroviensis CBS 8507]OCF71165.1 hypothetical protein I204_08118 [Kwoniella mangroviensis CBS 8886]
MPLKQSRPTSVQLEIDQLIEDNLDIEIKPTIKSNLDITEEDLLKDIKPSLIDNSTPSPARKRSKSNTNSNTTKSTPKNKTKTNTSAPSSVKFDPHGTTSAKARFAEIIIESGLKGYDRNQVEVDTGLTKNQQIEMLKKGRGSLWKALYGFASTL